MKVTGGKGCSEGFQLSHSVNQIQTPKMAGNGLGLIQTLVDKPRYPFFIWQWLSPLGSADDSMGNYRYVKIRKRVGWSTSTYRDTQARRWETDEEAVQNNLAQGRGGGGNTAKFPFRDLQLIIQALDNGSPMTFRVHGVHVDCTMTAQRPTDFAKVVYPVVHGQRIWRCFRSKPWIVWGVRYCLAWLLSQE